MRPPPPKGSIHQIFSVGLAICRRCKLRMFRWRPPSVGYHRSRHRRCFLHSSPIISSFPSQVSPPDSILRRLLQSLQRQSSLVVLCGSFSSIAFSCRLHFPWQPWISTHGNDANLCLSAVYPSCNSAIRFTESQRGGDWTSVFTALYHIAESARDAVRVCDCYWGHFLPVHRSSIRAHNLGGWKTEELEEEAQARTGLRYPCSWWKRRWNDAEGSPLSGGCSRYQWKPALNTMSFAVAKIFNTAQLFSLFFFFAFSRVPASLVFEPISALFRDQAIHKLSIIINGLHVFNILIVSLCFQHAFLTFYHLSFLLVALHPFTAYLYQFGGSPPISLLSMSYVSKRLLATVWA